MKLTHKQLRDTAKKLSISERAIERIMGSTTVEVPKNIDFETEDLHQIAEGSKERFELGLRLHGDTPIVWTSAVETLCIDCLKQYRASCPQAFLWICAGSFDPKKLPDNVNRAKVFHASRTASRLRAKVLREIQKALRL